MCGITGIFDLSQSKIKTSHLDLMVQALRHRGPDADGTWCEGNIGLGHTRLSIIDLSSAAAQPMICDEKRFVLTYNGEVYNFRELRQNLIELGYKFRSKSDSEVVLCSLKHWGKDALLKFNGMYALALWDRLTGTLLLARDRYGIKPLYYAVQNNNFYFGSEQKAILANPNFEKRLNAPGIQEYLTFQNFFSEQTLTKNIFLIPSGSYLQIDIRKQDIEITTYWDYEFSSSNKFDGKYNECVEELERLFKQGVHRQLVSDVEIGSYLSGGIDSGSISGTASLKSSDLKTFTIGYDMSDANEIELGFDERAQAKSMSSYFGTNHYESVIKSGDMERCIPNLVNHLEEPRIGQSYPNYYAAKLARKHVKVVFSGAGGDELFGGYPWRYFIASDCQTFDEYVDKYYLYWQRLVNNSDLQKLLSPIEAEISGIRTKDIFKKVFKHKSEKSSRPEDYVQHSLYFEAKTFLHSLLIVEDKISMSQGLETRVPFLDNDIVDFAMKCPVNYKLNNLSIKERLDENEIGRKTRSYHLKTNDGKIILRDAMQKIVPSDVLARNKQGFSAPDASWFRNSSRDYLDRTLLKRKNLIFDVLDFGMVQKLCEDHFSGNKNRRLLIWSLINLNEWFNQNFG